MFCALKIKCRTVKHIENDVCAHGILSWDEKKGNKLLKAHNICADVPPIENYLQLFLYIFFRQWKKAKYVTQIPFNFLNDFGDEPTTKFETQWLWCWQMVNIAYHLHQTVQCFGVGVVCRIRKKKYLCYCTLVTTIWATLLTSFFLVCSLFASGNGVFLTLSRWWNIKNYLAKQNAKAKNLLRKW